MYTGVAMAEVGIRELRNNLSAYLARVRDGEDIVITDHGVAVARILPLEEPRAFDRLVRDGLIEVAPDPQRTLPERVAVEGTVSDLVTEQRR